MWVVLGFLLSIIAHGVLEISYIIYAIQNGIVLENKTVFGYGYCVLPIFLQASLLILGIAGGFFSGSHWWRIVYVEKKVSPLTLVIRFYKSL